MRDVAQRAGVSLKTVSRVVNGHAHIRPEVVERVRAAIADLRYRPNESARTLRTGRTGVIGIGVPELRQPYFATLVEALVTEAEVRGLAAVVEPTRGVDERERSLMTRHGTAIDALVLIAPGPGLHNRPRAELPLVLLHSASDVDGADRVDDAAHAALAQVIGHLVVTGRRRIATIGPDRAQGLRQQRSGPNSEPMTRAVGISRFLERNDLVRDERLFIPVVHRWDRRSGARAMTELLEREIPFDAVVCANDELALGAMHVLWARGVRLPDDVALVGYDNIDDGRWSTPTLTTVDPGVDTMARMALGLLEARLSGSAAGQPERLVSPCELVMRESTLGRGAP